MAWEKETREEKRRGKHAGKAGEEMKSFLWGVHPTAYGPCTAQDGSECGPTQNYKFT